MSELSIQDLLFKHVHLGSMAGNGFYQVKCPCCNDYKLRGGWEITPTTAFYHCFNCPTKGSYSVDKPVSKNFVKILTAFGIPERDINQLKSSNFFSRQNTESNVITLESITKVNTYTPPVELPLGSIRAGSIDCPEYLTQEITNYLKSRNLDINDYPYYCSTEHKFKNRVIIPYYKQGKIIYWQARLIKDIPGTIRYLNCDVPRSAIIFNYDELFRNSTSPLFVTEGIFDALPLNGISLLGSDINEIKIELFRKSSRKLIFVIDNDIKGKTLGLKVIKEKLGSITFLPQKYDVNSYITETGKIWTVSELLRGQVSDGTKAKLKLNFIK